MKSNPKKIKSAPATLDALPGWQSGTLLTDGSIFAFSNHWVFLRLIENFSCHDFLRARIARNQNLFIGAIPAVRLNFRTLVAEVCACEIPPSKAARTLSAD